jgi:serine/threonine protein kinase
MTCKPLAAESLPVRHPSRREGRIGDVATGPLPETVWSHASAASGVSPGGPASTAKAGRDVPVLVAGRYRVESLLGRGGMGAVWLARDELLLRPVAIKEFTVPESVVDSRVASARVLSEAQAASRVCHPGVVRVYDIVTDDGRPWIVMEALAGPTLAQVIRRDAGLPVRRVVDVGLQLLEGLRAVHANGVIHRDVKPSNVQLCGTRRVVLTDFGVAAVAAGAGVDEPGQLFGSPPYTAPEAITSRRFSPASDLFSLGATLYAAVEGRQPFSDLTPYSTLAAVMREEPSPAYHAERLQPVIDGLLMKDPGERMGLEEAYLLLKDVESELAPVSAPRSEAARHPRVNRPIDERAPSAA